MQETIVRLRVLSPDQTPDELTARIGLPCDRSWRTGTERGRTILREKENGWELGSGLPRAATLEEHIKAIMLRLNARSDAIRSLSVTCDVELSCVVYADEPPAVGLGKPVISWLADLGASLDVDLYVI